MDCEVCCCLNCNMTGKKYCEQCLKVMYKECIKCKLPFPFKESFYIHLEICNRCVKKAQIAKEKYAERKIKKAQMKLDKYSGSFLHYRWLDCWGKFQLHLQTFTSMAYQHITPEPITSVHQLFERYKHKKHEKLVPLFIIFNSINILPPFRQTWIDMAQLHINKCWSTNMSHMACCMKYLDRIHEILVELLFIPQYGQVDANVHHWTLLNNQSKWTCCCNWLELKTFTTGSQMNNQSHLCISCHKDSDTGKLKNWFPSMFCSFQPKHYHHTVWKIFTIHNCSLILGGQLCILIWHFWWNTFNKTLNF